MLKKFIGTILLAGVIGSACAQALPPGSYQSSCGNFYWQGPTNLIGYCEIATEPGGPPQQVNGSNLPNANLCTYIENINGVLTCTGGYMFKGGLCPLVVNINGELRCQS